MQKVEALTNVSVMVQGRSNLPPHRHLLKDISENSQEGLDSSHGHSSSQGQSSSSHMSHMAASAFAALSQVGGFQADESPDPQDEDQAQDQEQDHLGSAGSAQADQKTAKHEQAQAQSPDGESDVSKGAAHTQSAGHDAQAAEAHSAPLTADSLSKLAESDSEEEARLPRIATTTAAERAEHAEPGQGTYPQPPGSIGRSSETQQTGSEAGSQTFDSELHDSISALVQAPGNADYNKGQPEQPPKGSSDPKTDASILQSVQQDVDAGTASELCTCAPSGVCSVC